VATPRRGGAEAAGGSRGGGCSVEALPLRRLPLRLCEQLRILIVAAAIKSQVYIVHLGLVFAEEDDVAVRAATFIGGGAAEVYHLVLCRHLFSSIQ